MPASPKVRQQGYRLPLIQSENLGKLNKFNNIESTSSSLYGRNGLLWPAEGSGNGTLAKPQFFPSISERFDKVAIIRLIDGLSCCHACIAEEGRQKRYGGPTDYMKIM